MYDTADIKKICSGGVPQPHSLYLSPPTNQKVIATITSLCDLFDRYEPDDEAKELLKDDVKIIISDRYPHNKYHYRVYLLPHKFNKDDTAKSKYIDWLRSQSPRITCTNAVERWIMKTNWNWDRRYVLVEDKNTLMLLRLRNPEVVGSVYEFVLSDK
jgi:hypothetical protein